MKVIFNYNYNTFVFNLDGTTAARVSSRGKRTRVSCVYLDLYLVVFDCWNTGRRATLSCASWFLLLVASAFSGVERLQILVLERHEKAKRLTECPASNDRVSAKV
jgi:hypothetical protein